ncbi:Fatty acid synthase [Camponotus floridanus]|uniref:Fatty acid synthase n=1 Tax=Camponotus floridanus TaxID=104421 RepID=E2AVQ3_CAMFO|nr:Fatty acid synthase [Camponotus floridanus]
MTFKNQSPQTFEEIPLYQRHGRQKGWMNYREQFVPNSDILSFFLPFHAEEEWESNASQTNYGMANSVMERICERRMKEGLHGLAIQWGALGDGGLVADMQKDDKELVIGGTLQQGISSCLDTLEVSLLQERPIVSSMVFAKKKNVLAKQRIHLKLLQILWITESAIQIRYVEGTHVTMMDNDEVVSLINESL